MLINPDEYDCKNNYGLFRVLPPVDLFYYYSRDIRDCQNICSSCEILTLVDVSADMGVKKEHRS